ncbi:DNA/RNA non-specific endonuclease [Chitinophaga pinensis]|uniref:DNA/RNA non-specific endonuclease n=1 Tax=Chitinophaga pinensis (strain ATCC 43595 / DSM 2588 / LMG 13176 / NBRC 15968 / NCIMB 11800 / UQM 2034) TaxID=485918 RepID=A0A979G3H7_CHIPD|nr:DNA/RNA non-specific endonuclease [Chitinophaga pinensis]ACU60099.1 DNA/RNA non-specific endonuclease [Chitinophaga pinensis DSM 2588]
MRTLTRRLLWIAVFSAFIASCTKDDNQTLPTPSSTDTREATVEAITLSENFESGTKAAYAATNVTLGSGSWNFDDALIGNLSTDAKTGVASARIRNTGSITMNFNATGANTISIAHAVFGSDGSSTWQLWISTNNGSTYTQTGSTVTCSSTSLQTVTFNVNVTGNVRLSIRKVSGGSNRINIDNITINTTGGGTGAGDNSHLLLGNPSGAMASIAFPTNYLVDQTYYSFSYNNARSTPNWVSWHLNSGDVGSTSRQDDFRPNTALPTGWYQVGSGSYSGSGFDRGHNCPSGDRTSSVAANSSTFLMTNMIPQAPQNNQQTWNNLEIYIRSLVTAGNEVYIIMGNYGTGGTGSNGGTSTSIDNGHVTVPSNVWKVIIVIPDGNNDLSRISTSTRVIAVNTPNINSISSDWKSYRTTVDAIESATGYDLLSGLPTNVQQVIEAQVDNL